MAERERWCAQCFAAGSPETLAVRVACYKDAREDEAHGLFWYMCDYDHPNAFGVGTLDYLPFSTELDEIIAGHRVHRSILLKVAGLLSFG